MPAHRLIFLDNLRILALLGLVLYHVGMVYSPWPWHVKSASLVPALVPWMRLLNPWRMSLLFVISGAVTSLALAQAPVSWLRARLWRLGAPLLAGVMLIVPPQAWWQVRDQFGYGGSLPEFMLLYWQAWLGPPRFCEAAGPCLQLPTWNHLWFLPYLMSYTAVLWFSLRCWPVWLTTCAAWLGQRLNLLTLLLAPCLLLVAARLALRPWFDITHDLTHDPLAHAQYGPAFLFGAWWARTPGVWSVLARHRWCALGLGLLAWALDMALAEPALIALNRICQAVAQWCGVLAALGFGQAWLGTRRRFLARVSGLVFPMYVLHQTLLIGLVVALRPLHWPASGEAIALLVGTLASSWALTVGVSRVRWLAPWLGAKPEP